MRKFKKTILPVVLSISMLGLAGCSSTGNKYVSSKAGDVTDKDIIEYIGNTQLAKSATDIITKKVLLEKYKDKINDKAIQSEYDKTQETYGGKDKFEAALKQQGFTADKYKEALKVKAAQTYMVNEYNNVSEDTLKEAYEKNKTQYHLAHILITVKSDSNPNGLSDEEAKAKAEEVLKKIKEGGDFATLAKENSTDTSNASNGGDLGWSSKDDSSFVTEFSSAAFALKKGEVSGVVKTQYGYHIIKMLDTKEVSYDDIKAELESKLAQEAVTKDSTIFTKALKKVFDEYQVKGDTTDVENYIKSMLDGNSTTTSN